MSQLTLFAELECKSWPEEIVEGLNGRMTVIERGQSRLYCARDWVYTVSGSTSQNRNNPLNDLKRALQKRGEWTRIYETFIEAPNPVANQRQMAYSVWHVPIEYRANHAECVNTPHDSNPTLVLAVCGLRCIILPRRTIVLRGLSGPADSPVGVGRLRFPG